MSDELTYRQSFLALAANCPLAAKMDRDGADYSTHAQARGTLLHSFAEQVIRECVEAGEPKYAPEQGKTLMGELVRRSGLPLPPEEHHDLMDIAWRFCDERTFDVEHVVDLEQTYTLQVGPVTVTGKPDFIAIDDRIGTIIDYKTSFYVPPEASARGTFQGRLYGRMAFDTFPFLAAVRVILDPVRWGVGAQKEAVLTRSDLPDIDDYLEGLVHRVVKAEVEDDWEASPGSWCATMCPNQAACPIPAAERGDGSVATPEQAAEAAQWSVATRARLNQTQRALRAYADNPDNPREPLIVGDLEFGFSRDQDGWSVIDRDLLRADMQAAGMDWDRYFKPRPGPVKFTARRREIEKNVDLKEAA